MKSATHNAMVRKRHSDVFRAQSVFALLALGFCFALPAEPLAQGSITPGTRVRITAPGAGLSDYDGTLEKIDRDSLAVDSKTIALASMTSLEVRHFRTAATLVGAAVGVATVQVVARAVSNDWSTGYAIIVLPSALTGAAIGASPKYAIRYGAIGMLAGAALGAVFFAIEPAGSDDISGTEYFAIYTGVPAGVGLTVGSMVGALTHLTHWRQVPVDRLRVGVAPTGNGGLAVGLQLVL